MAQQATIEAASRRGSGKGAARSLRREGKIPAVIYGRGRDPEPLAVTRSATTRLVAHRLIRAFDRGRNDLEAGHHLVDRLQ